MKTLKEIQEKIDQHFKDHCIAGNWDSNENWNIYVDLTDERREIRAEITLESKLTKEAPELLNAVKELISIAAGRYFNEKSLALKAEWKGQIDNAEAIVKRVSK